MAALPTGELAALLPLADGALLVALSSTRVAVAFMLLPLFAPETVPALVRNAIFIALGVLVLALQPPVASAGWQAPHWIGLFAKEALLGLALGFGLAAFLWAFEAAGQMVDMKVGTSGLQLTDPMSGHQVSGSAALLGRYAGVLFISGGGFMLFVGTLLDSFRLWPVAQMAIVPRRAGQWLFEQHFAGLMDLAFLLAAPALVLMFAVDLVLGLVNRFAPQINLLAISASLKALAATAVWLLLLATLADGFGDALAQRLRELLPSVARLLASRGTASWIS
jgi:type III secretion protein T